MINHLNKYFRLDQKQSLKPKCEIHKQINYKIIIKQNL